MAQERSLDDGDDNEHYLCNIILVLYNFDQSQPANKCTHILL